MIQSLISQVVDVLVQLLVVGIGTGLLYLGKIAVNYINTLKQKDSLHIIDMITNRAVTLVQAELTGASGEEKLVKATEYASKFLAEHGIHLTPDRLRADIEDGYNKLPPWLTALATPAPEQVAPAEPAPAITPDPNTPQ